MVDEGEQGADPQSDAEESEPPRPVEEAVADARAKKERADVAYREDRAKEALGLYMEAEACLDEVAVEDDKFRAILASNQAACWLRFGRWGEAEVAATLALAADPECHKAAYRRGVARLKQRKGLLAYEDLQNALKQNPKNAEIRHRCDEARRLAEVTEPQIAEVLAATNAMGALGGADGGLYPDKHDVNVGRLAETYEEQRKWVATISDWKEITEISFADEPQKSTVTVYMTLPGILQLEPNKVCVWMEPTSLEVRVLDLKGTNWCWVAKELWGPIDPVNSSYKIRKDKLTIILRKRESSRSFDQWEKLRRI